MSHRPIDADTLLAYVDDQLDPAQRAAIEAQLAAAPELRAEAVALQRLQHDLRAAFEVADYLPAPPQRVASARSIRRDQQRRFWLVGTVGVVVTLLLLAAFVTLFVTTQPILAPKVATRSSPTLVPLPLPSAIPAGPFMVTRPLLTGQLVFATLRNQVGDGGCGRLGIYLLAGSATPSRHLADGCNPVLSPNGQLVTYVRAGQLWVAATTGGGERSVSGDGVVDGITFVMEREGRTDIYRVNTDGSQLVRLTNSAAFTDGWTAFEPVWSPDGQHLAMIGSTKPWGPEANWDVYVVNSDGSGLTRLTDDPAREGPIAWSPDGTRLLFWSERDGGHINVYLMQTDGRQVTQVTHGAYDSRASWSPDGTQIALASTEDGQIYVASIENHTITQITTGMTHSYNPIWSDDGQYIFFGAFADTGDSAWIYSVRLDGQELAPLITTTRWLQWTQH